MTDCGSLFYCGNQFIFPRTLSERLVITLAIIFYNWTHLLYKFVQLIILFLCFLGDDLPVFPVEQKLLPEISRRVNLVRQIETREYRYKLIYRHVGLKKLG